MLSKLTEQDFEVLRGPLESGRQRPAALAGVLVLCAFLQALLFALEYFVAGGSTAYPYKDEILAVHLWFTAGLIGLSLFYAIPAIYSKSGRIQYLLSIVVSQNLFSPCLFISALFLIGKEGDGHEATAESLLTFTYIILAIGFLAFVATSIRFYGLLKKGEYRKGSSKDALRAKFEAKSYIPMASIAGLGLVFVIQYIARNSAIDDLNTTVIIVIGMSLFFVMLFVLPEQLVILYCKYRFKSFNFDERGNLNKQQ